jgi:hypothetical protein
VHAYYHALEMEDFTAAWNRLEPSVQAQLAGFSAWKQGFQNTVSTHLSTSVTAANASTASVATRLRSTDLDACGNDVVQHFSGTWQLERVSGHWRVSHVSVHKTGGGTPVTDISQCGSSSGGSPSAPSAPSPSGGPFCDTNTCIDNFENGTGYIVQCADGEWSHSGGRPGACSYHGGETDNTYP